MAIALAGSAAAQSSGDMQPPTPSASVLPLEYVGSNARITATVDEDGRIAGELLGIFGHNGKRAFLAQSWFGDGGAGGVQLDYHWLLGGGEGGSANVIKLFGAADRNRDDDRKATLGLGYERVSLGFDLYYAHALTDERLVSQDRDSVTETIFGAIDGRPFQQDITIDTLIERFEHPYEHGIGFRVSRFFEPALLRMRAGLDYERGEALLQGDNANQLNVMLGLEKYFRGTGHSLALEVEHFRKDGPFDRAAFGGERDGTRAAVFWRYEFGHPFRPAEIYRMVPVQRTAKIERAAPTLIRNEVQLSGKALFALDTSVLTETGRAELQPLLERLKQLRVGQVEIVGHTCDLGTDTYNQALSERRAVAVRDWLIAEGVDPLVLMASGEGERRPRHPNDTEENRARNRRIELRFNTFEEEAVVTSEPPSVTTTEWVREAVPQSPAWIERALRTPAFHKRAVDTYRIQRVTQTRTEGPIVPLNQTPTAADDAAQTTQASPVTIDVLANDSDADGNVLTVSAVSDPARGVASISADGTIVYAPDADFIGTDTFTYTVEDGNGGSATATVTVTVGAVPNRSPVANDDTAQTAATTTVSIDVLSNDSDPDGDALTVSTITDPADGSASINADGTIAYTPDTNFVGTDTFSYTVEDGNGGSTTATVAVTVTAAAPGNNPPLAVDDSVTAQSGNFLPVDVRGNDSDPDGDAFTVTAVTQPTNGSVSIVSSGGAVVYRSNPGATGADSFTYTITDQEGLTDTATVTITLEAPQNRPPIALDDTASTLNGDPVDIPVLVNDSDPDGDALLINGLDLPGNGTVVSSPAGVLTYTPNTGFTGADSFSYSITDGNGGDARATVTVTVSQTD